MVEVQSQNLSKQRAPLTSIMSALKLELPVDSTSKDLTSVHSVNSTPKPELSQKKFLLIRLRYTCNRQQGQQGTAVPNV
jgi:hypothetical protein